MNTVQVTMWGDGLDFEKQTLLKPEDPEFEISFELFPLIVELLKQNQCGTEIHAMIREGRVLKDFAISAESKERAEKIRKYFKQSFLLRRLKNEFISNWMNTVDVALDATETAKQSWLAPLISLPRFYEEGIATDKIFKSAKPLDPTKLDRNYKFQGEVKFVGKVHRVAKNANTWRYYFKDQKENLLLLETAATNNTIPILEFLVQSAKSIIIDATVGYTLHPGHDFLHYRLTSDYEIVKINS